MRLIDADALKGEKFYSHERHENCVSVYAIDTIPTIEPDRPYEELIKDIQDMMCKVNDYYGYTDSMHLFKVLFDQKFHGWVNRKEGDDK